MTDIKDPGDNDVLFGRGGLTNNFKGNIRFRLLVNGHKLRYLAATKVEKPMVAREVVSIWRNLVPPGRFLSAKKTDKASGSAASTSDGGSESNNNKMLWSDVGDKKAREKASQSLRERTAEVQSFLEMIEIQRKLEEYEIKVSRAKPGEEVSMPPELKEISALTCNGRKLTAADISLDLLRQQQQAAGAAHMELKASLPMGLMPIQTDVHGNDNNNNGLNPNPIKEEESTSPKIKNEEINNDNSEVIKRQRQQDEEAARQIKIRKDQLRASIAALEKHAEELNAYSNSMANLESSSIGQMVPLAADLLEGIDDIMGPSLVNEAEEGNLTMEEYQKSVSEYLQKANEKASTTEENSKRSVLTRSKHASSSKESSSWLNSFNSIDEMSLTSNLLLLTPNSSNRDMHQMQPGEITAFAHQRAEEVNTLNTKSEKSMLSIDSFTMSAIMNGDRDHPTMPPPANLSSRTGISMMSGNYNNSRPNLQTRMSNNTGISMWDGPNSARAALATHISGISGVSMMSDLSNLSSNKNWNKKPAAPTSASNPATLSPNNHVEDNNALRNQKMNSNSFQKSDVSMNFSEITDLSDAMGSMDMNE